MLFSGMGSRQTKLRYRFSRSHMAAVLTENVSRTEVSA